MRLDINAPLVKTALAASRWPRLTIAVWVLVLVFAVGVAARFGDRLEGGFGTVPGSISARVDATLEEKFDQPFAQFIAVILHPEPDQPVPGLSGAARDLQTVLGTDSSVRRTMQWSKSRSDRVVVLVGLNAQSLAAAERLVPVVRARIQSWRANHPGIAVTTTGVAAFDVDVAEYAAQQASAGEQRVVPVMLLALLAIFGSLAAAAIPLAIGMAAVVATVGLLGAIACFWPLSAFAINIASMIGLGLGIDYSLLTISRWREIREAGASAQQALTQAVVATAPTLTASGVTVAAALAAILWVPALDAQGLGMGGMIVALMAVLAGLTLLPALATLAGPYLDRARWLPGPSLTATGIARWEARVSMVLQRPKTFLFGALVLLVTLSWPAGNLLLAFPEVAQVPKSLEAVRGWHLLSDSAGATELTPIRVIIKAPDAILSAQRLQGVAALITDLRTRPWVGDVRSPLSGTNKLWVRVAQAAGPERVKRFLPEPARWYVDREGKRLLLDIITTPNISNFAAKDLVRALRQENWSRFPQLAGCQIDVGGPAAQALDIDDAVIKAGPIVVCTVVLITLLMLFVFTRSVLLPIKAVVANAFTVTAALGVTIGLFLNDTSARLIGLSGALPGIPPGLVLLLFCVVFGLSMDYEIFLLHRVVEGHRAGMSDAQAIRHGVGRSAGIISGGAFLMILVFAGFSLTDLAVVKMLGVSLAVGVLLDATVVRLILVPAFMMVAGRYNWLPGFPPVVTPRDMSLTRK
jgi:RND superfamily putative drug exporter